MFLLEIKPWQSSKWVAPQGEDLVTAENLRFTNGVRGIRKMDEARREEDVRYENIQEARANSLNPAEASGVRGNSLA